MSTRSPDLISVLEAAYVMDLPLRARLKGLMTATRAATDDGLGIAAYAYDTSERPFRVQEFMTEDCPVDDQGIARLMDHSNDDFVRRSWLIPSAATASETPGYESLPAVHEVFHPAGIRDVLVINALDPVGVGVWIGAPQRELRTLSGSDRERWNRVAMHVRAALRLRLRLSAQEPDQAAKEAEAEAVLTPTGKIEHLTKGAEQSQQELRDAVLAVEQARGEMRKDVDRALPFWKALVQARWTLVDDFQADGRRYVLARSNELSTAPLERLAPRERQVAACMALGHTNKEVAYELGLSHSTVRVLVARAASKLGAKNRDELIAIYRQACLK